MKTPLTIVSGYLGAGKTSLLQYILNAQHGWRIAVIMNEFGESIGAMERDLITPVSISTVQAANASGNQSPAAPTGPSRQLWLNMANGCLCCAGVDKGLKALDEMLASNKDIDWIIVEAQGMADPAAFVKQLWADDGLQLRVCLDAVVCVVDASRPSLYSQSWEAMKQAALADVLVINKMDRADGIQALAGRLSQLNPSAVSVRTTFGSVPLTHLFNLQAFSQVRLDRCMSALCISPSTQHQLRPVHLMVARPIRFPKLEDWIFSFLWESTIGGAKIDPPIRIKGTSWDGKQHRHFQAVEDVYEARLAEYGADGHDLTVVLMVGDWSGEQVEFIKGEFHSFLSDDVGE